MYYVVIFAYLALGVASAYWCIQYSKKFGVKSTFTIDGLSEIISDSATSPLVIVVVVPFAAAFWPLLCLMDLTEIPKKRRLNQKQSEAATKIDEREIARINLQRLQSVVGRTCETTGVLTPMGIVRIDGQNWDAISKDGYVAAERRVVVTGLRGKLLEVSIHSEGQA